MSVACPLQATAPLLAASAALAAYSSAEVRVANSQIARNEQGIGASSGIVGMMTLISLKYPSLMINWSPIPIFRGLVMIPLLFSICLNLGLDYLGNYLYRDPLYSVPEKYRWYVRNLNLFRYGLTNISFYGHLGGFISGVLLYLFMA